MMKNSPENSDNEKLKEENDYLKMKLMLEHGARFGGENDLELPAELEHIFLKEVMRFEERFSRNDLTTVFEQLGKPTLKPVAEIPDDRIESEWKRLQTSMKAKGILLEARSPNVSSRELYRFAAEELIHIEVIAMNFDGWITHFIYDEFYPDKNYENEQKLKMLFESIFSREMDFPGFLFHDAFVVNGSRFEDQELFRAKLEKFKSVFEELALADFKLSQFTNHPGHDQVKGYYKAFGSAPGIYMEFSGAFEVFLHEQSSHGLIQEIRIGGFDI